MKAQRSLASLLGIVVLLALPAMAGADNTACPNATWLVPDASLHEGMFTAVFQARWYRVVVKAGRSYAISTENLSPTDVGTGFVGLFTPVDGCGGSAVSTVIRTFTEPVSSDGTTGAARRALQTSTDTVVFFSLSGSSPATFRVHVAETTLFSPGWSTFGGFQTFWSFLNTTNDTINGTLTLLDANGGFVPAVGVAIPTNRAVFPSTLTMAIGANQSGTARFTDDGPPGAILAEAAITNFAGYFQPVRFVRVRERR